MSDALVTLHLIYARFTPDLQRQVTISALGLANASFYTSPNTRTLETARLALSALPSPGACIHTLTHAHARSRARRRVQASESAFPRLSFCAATWDVTCATTAALSCPAARPVTTDDWLTDCTTD